MTRPDFEPSPLADIDCVADDDRWTLVFVRDMLHAPEKVWAALTDPAQLRAWAPYTASRDLGSTGDATLTTIDGETTEESTTSVTRVERPTLLEYEWGSDVLRWELTETETETGTGTRLTLRHTVNDREWLPKVAAGWHICFDVAERLLDGHPIGPIRGRDAMNYGWQALNDAYAKTLDITTTGWPDNQTA